MTARRAELAAGLMDIEYQLRSLRLWSDSPPSAAALASEEPFAIDTLAFEQWLQFIFLPRMRDLLENHGALPQHCVIAPMAEQAYGPNPAYSPLVKALREFDRHFA